jgi:hypothetical protein
LSEPWDQEEANRLTGEANDIEMEFLDVSEWGRRIDAELRDGRLARDEAAVERALAENRRLAELCRRRSRLWEDLAAALEERDLGKLRVKAEVIRQPAEDQFRRRRVS